MNEKIVEKLLATLVHKDVIYCTRNGILYSFEGVVNHKLVFSIPSRTPGKKANLKRIPISVLNGLIEPWFNDCRLNVLKSLVHRYSA